MRIQSSTTLALTAACLALAALGGCGSSGSQTNTDAGPGGLGGSPGGDAAQEAVSTDAPALDAPVADTTGDVAPGDTSASDASGAVDNRETHPDGAPSASELEGAWYATVIAQPDGGLSRHQRLRFAGGAYYLIYQTPSAYCGEVGAYQVAGAGVTFTPDHVEGGTACPSAAARVEPVRWTGDGITFDTTSGAATYQRARAVPKVFVTFEAHDGNLAGDPSLPGVFAIDKADAICARSIARPDGATYKALLADGLRRTPVPANDWVLAPDTTYFQPDGVLNAFTSSVDAAAIQAHRGILAEGPPFGYAWIWLPMVAGASARTTSCRSWTSNSSSDSGALADPGSFYRLGGMCNTPYPFICVASPLPTPADRDGGATDAGAANDPVLQGAWSVAPVPFDAGGGTGRRRLRFDADRYDLVVESSLAYCGEIGTFRSSGTSVAFTPQRIIGTGPCTIGVDRVETLDVGTSDITLSSAGASQHYQRAPDVPKVFATLEVHGSDLADDALLAGTNAVEKADSFCNRSAARPDGRSYKAVLADGTHRAPALGWPLQPATQYFDSRGLVGLFTPSASGLITGATAADALVAGPGALYLWTGIAYDFTTHGEAVSPDTCSGWTSNGATPYGAAADGSSAYTLSSGVVGGCPDASFGLICAGQP